MPPAVDPIGSENLKPLRVDFVSVACKTEADSCLDLKPRCGRGLIPLHLINLDSYMKLFTPNLASQGQASRADIIVPWDATFPKPGWTWTSSVPLREAVDTRA